MIVRSNGRTVLGAVLAAALLAPVAAAAPVSAQETCPEPPLTVGGLLDLYLRGGPLRERYPMAVTQINEAGHACYGSRTLTLRVFVAPPGGVGGTQAYHIEPGWLGDHGLLVWDTADLDDFGHHEGGSFLTVAVPPEFGEAADRFNGRWILLTSRFDHPASESCVASGVEGQTPSPAEAIEICRSFLVLTGIEALPPAPATDTVPLAGLSSPSRWPAAFGLLALVTGFGLAAMRRSRGAPTCSVASDPGR